MKQLEPLRGLVIRQPFVEWILGGKKTWEIRGTATAVRGHIALISKGTGTVVGTCNVTAVRGPLKLAELKANAKRLNATADELTSLYYGRHTYAWVLADVRRLRTPIKYSHPSGAVIWVKLSARIASKLGRAGNARRFRKRAKP